MVCSRLALATPLFAVGLLALEHHHTRRGQGTRKSNPRSFVSLPARPLSGGRVHAAGEDVVEIGGLTRARGAKNDRLDAARAARTAMAREHQVSPRARGLREAIRALSATPPSRSPACAATPKPGPTKPGAHSKARATVTFGAGSPPPRPCSVTVDPKRPSDRPPPGFADPAVTLRTATCDRSSGL